MLETSTDRYIHTQWCKLNISKFLKNRILTFFFSFTQKNTDFGNLKILFSGLILRTVSHTCTRHQLVLMFVFTTTQQIQGWEQKRSLCFFTYIHLDLFRSHPSKYAYSYCCLHIKRGLYLIALLYFKNSAHLNSDVHTE